MFKTWDIENTVFIDISWRCLKTLIAVVLK